MAHLKNNYEQLEQLEQLCFRKPWLSEALLQISKYKPFSTSNNDTAKIIHLESYEWWTAYSNKRQIPSKSKYGN